MAEKEKRSRQHFLYCLESFLCLFNIFGCCLRGRRMQDHLTILDTCTCTSSLPLNLDHNVIHMAALIDTYGPRWTNKTC
jgi:hypothetical protein